MLISGLKGLKEIPYLDDSTGCSATSLAICFPLAAKEIISAI